MQSSKTKIHGGECHFPLLNPSTISFFYSYSSLLFFSLSWKAWIFTDGKEGSFSGAVGELSLRNHDAIKSQRGITQPCPYPGTFWYPAGWLPKFTQTWEALAANFKWILQSSSSQLLISKWWKGSDFFLAVMNWAVLGLCETMRKFLLILSDTFFSHARHIFLHHNVPIYKEFHAVFFPFVHQSFRLVYWTGLVTFLPNPDYTEVAYGKD